MLIEPSAAAFAARYAAGPMAGWYGAQIPGAIRHALKRYKKFKNVRPFWR